MNFLYLGDSIGNEEGNHMPFASTAPACALRLTHPWDKTHGIKEAKRLTAQLWQHSEPHLNGEQELLHREAPSSHDTIPALRHL